MFGNGAGSTKNGVLLALAANEFDVFITSDQNIRYQQNLMGSNIAVLELDERSSPHPRSSGHNPE